MSLLYGLITACTWAQATVQGVPWPGVDQLPAAQSLPDPFTMRDGSRVSTRADWDRRREEIKAMLEYYEYGHMPPAPDNLRAEVTSSESAFNGGAKFDRVHLTLGPDHKVQFDAALYVPTRGAGPFPVLLAIEPIWNEGLLPAAQLAISRGYIFAGYQRHDLDPDDEDRTNGVHPIYPQYDWATLAVWAWGAMRTLDYVFTRTEVDRAHVALTGHSRGGKTALVAAAFDDRFTLVAPHNSGTGGSGSLRIFGEGSETLEAITHPKRFHYWFQPRLRDFVRKEDRLPFDQHFLKALVAPRCIVSVEGLDDHWANALGTQHVWRATQPVFDFLGAPDRNVLFFRNGGHGTPLEDWKILLDYCDHFFFGRPQPNKSEPIPFVDTPPAFSWSAPK